MINTGIDIDSITPGTSTPFYYKGALSDGGETSEEDSNMSEITVVDMDEMIGSVATYSISFSGTTKQVYKALDWITDNEEKMSIGDVNLSFNSSTGKLSGTIGINFYCMLGNGVPYKDPDVSEFSYGVDDVFSSFSTGE
jgi:hypothetical protein